MVVGVYDEMILEVIKKPEEKKKLGNANEDGIHPFYGSIYTYEEDSSLSYSGPGLGSALKHMSMHLNETKQLCVIKDNEYIKRKDIKWSSSNPLVAVVKKGLVKPVFGGKTTITAEYKGHKYTCVVEVASDSIQFTSLDHIVSGKNITLNCDLSKEKDVQLSLKLNGEDISYNGRSNCEKFK